MIKTSLLSDLSLQTEAELANWQIFFSDQDVWILIRITPQLNLSSQITKIQYPKKINDLFPTRQNSIGQEIQGDYQTAAALS